jgi:hypothetical protein
MKKSIYNKPLVKLVHITKRCNRNFKGVRLPTFINFRLFGFKLDNVE